MAQVDLSDYKTLYVQTTRRTIDNLLLGCNKLANNLQDKEILNSIHIESHSLKGRSQAMGFMDIADICFNIEKTSDDALKGVAQLNSESVLGMKKSAEKLSEILQQI